MDLGNLFPSSVFSIDEIFKLRLLREYHPRIYDNQAPLKTRRIILGSFPVWSMTNSELDNKLTLTKEEIRMMNGDFQYFYGSSNNRFWQWYKNYIDNDIECNCIESINQSIDSKGIGITDVIFSCIRKGTSALDKHLSSRKYNHNFFEYPKEYETIKVLCTSKGVMNDMLLVKSFFSLHRQITINERLSERLQTEILKSLVGNSDIVKPIVRVLEVRGGGTIECFSIPSPGSPHRRLLDFGFREGSMDIYLNKYLKIAFKWFS